MDAEAADEAAVPAAVAEVVDPVWGVTRALGTDPAVTTAVDITGNVAALVKNFGRMMRPLLPEAARGEFDALAVGLDVAIAASDVSSKREKNTRELKSVTQIPTEDFGPNTNIANIRLQNINIFKGDSTDQSDVLRWLSRTLSLAKSNRLRLDSVKSLLHLASAGGASDYLEPMLAEGKSLQQIIPLLEMRYAALCPSEEARAKCNSMPRKPDEGFAEFMDRLRAMARMACRDEDDEGQRKKMIDLLVEGNIRRVLSRSVKLQLEERIKTRRVTGHPELNSRELEAECIDLERRRAERKQLEQPVNKKYVRKVTSVKEYDSELSDDSSSDSSEAEETSEDPQEQLIRVVQQERKNYEARGIKPGERRLFKRSFRQFEKKNPPPRAGKEGRYQKYAGARQAFDPVHKGPPEQIVPGTKMGIYDLLKLACVPRGSCIQCGMEGHMLRDPKCPLKSLSLVDRPCVKCGQGLHQADMCVKAFQNTYGAKQEQTSGANPIQEISTEVKND